MNYGFGIDLGGTAIKLGLFQEDGKLLQRWEVPTQTEKEGKAILPQVAQMVAQGAEKWKIAKKDIWGIGIGVPGPVDDEGFVNGCVNLNWKPFSLKQVLEEMTGLPVKVANDANAAAYGEYCAGGGKGSQAMLMVTLGTGIGGGFVAGGKVLNGAHGVAGELGHITVNRQETEPCTCGKWGCAEQYASGRGMVRLAQRRLESTDRESMLRQLPSFAAEDIFACAKAGDGVAREVLEEVFQILGMVIADSCCLLDPDTVVLGGGVSKAGGPLLRGVKANFDRYMFAPGKDIRFALATLGNDAGICGAFYLLRAERGEAACWKS